MRLKLYKFGGMSDDNVTVVIAARNEEACIGACLDSLLRQSLPAKQREIIVVDDGSDDHTAAIVSTLFTTVGQPHNPATAGKGGLIRGLPRLPSNDSNSAVSSPKIYAPPPT